MEEKKKVVAESALQTLNVFHLRTVLQEGKLQTCWTSRSHVKVSRCPGKSDYATSLPVCMYPQEDLRTWHLLNAAGVKSQEFISTHLTDIIWK